jgi:hypothetical protein
MELTAFARAKGRAVKVIMPDVSRHLRFYYIAMT